MILGQESLIRILAYYHININKNYTNNDIPNEIELACMVAKLFEARKIAEIDVINHFSSKYCLSTMDGNNKKTSFLPYQSNNHNFNSSTSNNKNNSTNSNNNSNSNNSNNNDPNKNNRNIKTNFERLQLDCEVAKIGEQVYIYIVYIVYYYLYILYTPNYICIHTICIYTLITLPIYLTNYIGICQSF